MSLYGALDKTKHLSEFNDPLPNGAGGYTSSASRKASVRANIGFDTQVATLLSAGVANARFSEQPLVAQATPTTQNSTGTMTAAQLLTFIITSTTAAAVSATLPTGTDLQTALLAAYPQLADLDSFDFSVINTGTNAFTILTATGWTLVGRMVVDVPAATASGSATFRVRKSGTNTFVLYRIA